LEHVDDALEGDQSSLPDRCQRDDEVLCGGHEALEQGDDPGPVVLHVGQERLEALGLPQVRRRRREALHGRVQVRHDLVGQRQERRDDLPEPVHHRQPAISLDREPVQQVRRTARRQQQHPLVLVQV
jgi:hypothetical protein